MHTVASESLLDEADFLAELALLEHGLPEKRQPLLADEARLPDVLAPVRTEKPGKFWEPERPTERATFVEENEDDSPAVGHFAVAGMFVLMMGVGAASAMLVYHERVARILAAYI